MVSRLFFQQYPYFGQIRAKSDHGYILWERTIRFISNGGNVSYDNPVLEFSDCIAITFEMEKNDTLHHKASGEMIMCPVRTAAELVPQIQSYPGTDGNIRRSLQYELDQERSKWQELYTTL
jgi:hypothetical protein